MATVVFRSPLAFWLRSFLEVRRAAGREAHSLARILRYLDRFLMAELAPGRPITREVAEKWVAGMQGLAPGTRVNRIGIMRQFCLYLSHFDPRTCIIHQIAVPCRCRPAPYIYSRSEIRKILRAAKQIGPRGSLRPATVSTIIGLLYASGLRIGEALRLKIGEVYLMRL